MICDHIGIGNALDEVRDPCLDHYELGPRDGVVGRDAAGERAPAGRHLHGRPRSGQDGTQRVPAADHICHLYHEIAKVE